MSRLRWWGGGGCKFGSCIICVYSIIINKRILTLRINCIIGPLQFPTLTSHLTAQLITIRMHPSFSSNAGFLSVSDFLALLPVQQPRLKFNSEIFSPWAADRFLSAPLKRSGLYFIMRILIIKGEGRKEVGNKLFYFTGPAAPTMMGGALL